MKLNKNIILYDGGCIKTTTNDELQFDVLSYGF